MSVAKKIKLRTLTIDERLQLLEEAQEEQGRKLDVLIERMRQRNVRIFERRNTGDLSKGDKR